MLKYIKLPLLFISLALIAMTGCGGSGGPSYSSSSSTPSLRSISVTPANSSIAGSTTRQFTATGTYSNSTTQNITNLVTWSSSSTSIATISNTSGSRGLASALSSTGTTTVSATYSGRTGSTRLTVTSATIVSISVTPANPSIARGGTQQFTATGTFSDSTTQDITTSVTWASNDASVTISNTIGSKGLATAVSVGSATISATFGGRTGTTTMTVTPPALTTITITPVNPISQVTSTVQFTARGTYSDNSTEDITSSVTWSSSNTSVATINSSGLATTTDTTGFSTITATLGSVSGTTRLTVALVVVPGSPTLFFSDLIWGPKTGWENSSTKGAAVTIWGKNLGSPSASSKITVNGADIISTNSTYIAEWGTISPARNLERITFWLNNTCADGAGTITVTVNGVISNALPFTVTSGTIYFISVSAGNNSNNGRYATAQGSPNGPFRDLYMFNPGLDSSHSAGSRNPSGDGQYIVYVRGGTYTTQDVDDAMIALRGPYGGTTRQKALIGYPGETPVINTSAANRGLVWNADYSPYGRNSYFTFAKLTGYSGTTAFDSLGDYNRFIGNTMQESRVPTPAPV
jgi:hypothetical protein